MSKPIIGVVPLFDTGRDSIWMLPGYMKGIEYAGALPVILPLTAEQSDIRTIAETCGGFLFTGGQDIDPSYYNEQDADRLCDEHLELRDKMELMLFREGLVRDKPMLGICRGIQAFNVFCGGTLYRDIPTERPSETEHHQEPPYSEPVHSVDIVSGTPLHTLLGKESIRVNSYHHQAIKKLSPRLCAMAYSEDGLVEAVNMPEMSWVWAVQWHPEYSVDESEESRKIFSEFIRNCKG